MSVYIPGMGMPDRCFSCPLCNIEPTGESSCATSIGPIIEYKEIAVETAIDTRPDWCPLIPVPDHGRLIDADAFIKRISELVRKAETEGFGMGMDWYPAFIRHIEIAPTIIPKEEEG